MCPHYIRYLGFLVSNGVYHLVVSNYIEVIPSYTLYVDQVVLLCGLPPTLDAWDCLCVVNLLRHLINGLYNCTHINEPQCAVKDAVEAGDIPDTRYNSYLNMFNEDENQSYR